MHFEVQSCSTLVCGSCSCDLGVAFFQLLAMLLKKKRSLLNSHILHLTFSLVGTVDSGHETSIIPNSTAFQDLLCDFEVFEETLTRTDTLWMNLSYAV